MKVHPAVLLTISDYCTQEAQPPHLQGPIFGKNNVAIACSKKSDESMPATETLQLLRKTNPQLDLIGWYYVGYGLIPEHISSAPDTVLILIEISPSKPPVIKAFQEGKEIELRLESDSASQIALENSVDFNQTHNERRVKLILRDRIASLKGQLKSNNPQDVSDALYKYAMLKKVYDLHKNAKQLEDDFIYELLAEVITKSDVQHNSHSH